MTQQIILPDPGPNAAETQLYRQALHNLIDIGADLARQLHAQAIAEAAQQAKAKPVRLVTEAPPASLPGPDALIKTAEAFDRVASAVRRCIMLAQSFDQPTRNPTEAVGTVLRHTARTDARWRLPPKN
ncbi:MAG: hypothetical protein ACRYHQ_16485 [Janthinobacterium lividum]